MIAVSRRSFRAVCTIFIWVLSRMAVIACLRNPIVLMRKTVESIPAMAEG
jgi:hypothetical protein